MSVRLTEGIVAQHIGAARSDNSSEAVHRIQICVIPRVLEGAEAGEDCQIELLAQGKVDEEPFLDLLRDVFEIGDGELERVVSSGLADPFDPIHRGLRGFEEKVVVS